MKPKAPVEGTHGEKAGGRGGAGPRLVSLSGVDVAQTLIHPE